eukprot:584712-Prymnesium_polylepis.1
MDEPQRGLQETRTTYHYLPTYQIWRWPSKYGGITTHFGVATWYIGTVSDGLRVTVAMLHTVLTLARQFRPKLTLPVPVSP